MKQADLYEQVDANLLDRMYKLLIVTPVSHPLIIVRARESVNWSESAEFENILAGNYPKGPNYYDWAGRRNGRNGSGSGDGGQWIDV